MRRATLALVAFPSTGALGLAVLTTAKRAVFHGGGAMIRVGRDPALATPADAGGRPSGASVRVACDPAAEQRRTSDVALRAEAAFRDTGFGDARRAVVRLEAAA